MNINHGAIYRRRRRTLAGSLLLVVLVIVIAALNGGGRLPVPAHTGTTGSPAGPQHVVYRSLVRLDTGLSDSAIAPLSATRFVIFGGLARSGGASRAIFTVSAPTTGPAQATLSGGLPRGLSGAAAVSLGGVIYLLGGRDGTRLEDTVYRYSARDGKLTLAGRLAHARADFAAAAIGGEIYLVGGVGTGGPLDTITTWRPGPRANSRTVGTLPQALSFVAVAVSSGRLFILGGLAQDAASSEILAFDPARPPSSSVTSIALLPHATTHAAAVAIGRTVYMIGGLRDAAQIPTAVVYAINTTTGQAVRAGLLPQGRSDIAALALGKRIELAGGRSRLATLDVIGELTAAAAAPRSG